MALEKDSVLPRWPLLFLYRLIRKSQGGHLPLQTDWRMRTPDPPLSWGKGSVWWEQAGEVAACDGDDDGRGGVALTFSSEGSIMSMLLSEDRSNSTLTSPLADHVTMESDGSFVPSSRLYFPVVVEKIQRESKEWKWKGPYHRAWHIVASTSSLFLWAS